MTRQTVETPTSQLLLFNEQSGALAQVISKIDDTPFFEGALTKTSAEGSTVTMPVEEGMTMLVAWFKGTYNTVTVLMEISRDNGVTFMPFTGANVNGGGATTNPLSSNTNEVKAWEAAIPAGSTHVRARCTLITSGTVEVGFAQGSSQYETVLAVIPSTVLNGAYASGSWVDLSSTPLSGAATFTGALNDLTGVATATAFTSTSGATTAAGQGEYRVSATSDKAGTLYLETSRDNGTTWTRVKGVALAKFDGTCEFYGEIVYRPSERYVRPVFVNGAEAQGKFKIQSMKVSVP